MHAAKVTLSIPLKTPGGEISSITFRRGIARDMLAAQRQEKDPARAEFVLMAMLTQEKLTPEDLEELDLADLAEVQAAFQGLFMRVDRQPSAVGAAGSAGQVVSLATLGADGAGVARSGEVERAGAAANRGEKSGDASLIGLGAHQA